MIPVRFLSREEAEILLRASQEGVASSGRVECHGLTWKSDALRTWEQQQRALGRKPRVRILIDELDLSVVFVETLEGDKLTLRALSTKPLYTQALSYFEHRKLKEILKKKQIEDRLKDMEDEQAFTLRIEYYAQLGRAKDPIAFKKMVALRDQLVALRSQQAAEADPPSPPLSETERAAALQAQLDTATAEVAEKASTTDSAGKPPESAPAERMPRGRRKKCDEAEARPEAPKTPVPATSEEQPTPAGTPAEEMQTLYIKRRPR